MDELNVVSAIGNSIVSGLVRKFIKKKTDQNIKVWIDKTNLKIIDGKAYLKFNAEIEVEKDTISSLIESLNS